MKIPSSALKDPEATALPNLLDAIALHQQGLLGQAEARYRQLLDIEPRNADALHLLGVIACQTGSHQRSVNMIDQAIKINANVASYHSNRGMALQGLKLLDAAVASFDKAIALKPDYAESYYNRGNVLQDLKQLDAAVASYNKAIALKPDYAEAYSNRGNILQDLKQLDAAIVSFDKVIALKPDLAEAYSNRGNVLQDLKQLDAAVASYDKAIALKPDYAEAYSNRGMALQELKQFNAAVASFDKAVALKADYAEAYSNRGMALQGLKQFNAAVASFDKAIALKPDYAKAYSNRGIALKELKQLDAAIASYDKAIALKPKYAEAYYNRGNTLQDLKQLDAAVASYDNAIALKPEYDEAYYNRGNTLQDLKQLDAAVASYNKAIALKPDLAEAYSNRGMALQGLKQFNAAVASFDKAIALKPDLAEAYSNRGNVLQDLKQLDAAVANYDKAIALKPDYAECYYNRGTALQVLMQLDAALTSYNKAIALKPEYAIAYSNRGLALKQLYRYAEAIKSTIKAIQINPETAEAQQSHSSMLAHLSDFSDVVEHSNAAAALKPDDPAIWGSRLYCYLYHPDLSAQEICAEHVRWGSQFPALDADIFNLHDRSPSRRLRVGYVSPDFRGHSCRFFFEPLFSQHDHTQFELFAYSNVLIEDEHTQRFKTYFDEWRNIRGVSDQAVVEMVRRDRIDILVDACGHMSRNRLAVFTHKPAPIQLTWEGWSWTTGLKQMDYVLFDPYMAPPGTLAIEEIIRLPNTRTVFRPGERAVNEPVKSLPALKTGTLTFGYSGRTERLNYKVFNAWGKILERLPTAQLVLDYKAFSDEPTQAYYRDFLAQHGIDVSRVTMRYSSNIFQGLGDIDILLDSFPHNGGTMLFDALWMGVPALTLASRPPLGRIGASVMTNIGLADWVAKDEDEYVNKAESFAKNIEELSRLRTSIRERMKASPLMDEAGFARDVESAFKNMWRRWCCGTKLADKLNDVDEIEQPNQSTSPSYKAKGPLVAPEATALPNLLDAIALHQQGLLGQAEARYRQLLDIEPRNADALHLLGVIACQTGSHQRSVNMIDQAIKINANVASYHSNRGMALQGLKLLDAAVASFDKAIALKPDYAESYYNRGNVLQDLKQLDAAVASYNKAIALKPDYAEAYSNRGNILQDLKQLDAAIVSFDKVIALKPDLAEAYSNRGNVLQDLKQLDAAVASYDKAIALKPDYAEAYSNRGMALQELKQFNAAVASFDKAVALKADYAEAYSNRGMALQGLKQFNAAVASFDKAIALKPDYAKAYSNRGIALKELKQFDAAVASFDKAIALKPDYAECYYNRGNTLQDLKQLDAAVASFDSAFNINPEVHYLLGARQHARMLVCDWSNLAKSLLVYETEVASNKPATTPFIALILVDKPALHLQSSKIFMEAKHPKNQALGEIAKRTAGDKLRLGYFSADLHYHPVAIWLAEQIENHDKSKFELFAFSFRSDIKDPMTDRLAAAFDHFIAVDKMSDLEVAQLSRQLGIDIALDLTGYTEGSRTGIFALQAAPIQVSHLGFPGSMGAEYIDYVIADKHLLPESAAKHYTEKIAYVPCGYTYDRQRQLSAQPLSRAQVGLPEKGFVFTCQNRCQKFLPEVFSIWMDILKAVPASVLWLMEPNPSAMENLIKEAQARGVESDRLVFTKRETVAADQEKARIGRYLASYKLADLFLDTWPYNAGTTAVDALWAGLPVLTKAGEAGVARLATSALHAIEVPELITNTAQEYQDLAVELASDPRKLKIITDKLQENRLTSALFDPVGNTRHIEAAYVEMYRRYQADLLPDHLYIDS